MPEVRIYNPTTPNPRRGKPWTQTQAASHKDQAERFTRDVLEDDDRADEIADMTPEEYAEERGKEVVPNPNPRRRTIMRKKSRSASQDAATPRFNPNELIRELEAENADLRSKLATDKLQSENADLREQLSTANSKLDQIDEICDCDDESCDAEEHLADIAEIIDGNGGNGNGNDDE